ncbi:MAG: cupin domain-containing protein [Myxococcota bacterium]|jgi:quercetin dioxygenase-like cupin family protein|nr:cupin domain-containing protein [Myxococcota bacterium]
MQKPTRRAVLASLATVAALLATAASAVDHRAGNDPYESISSLPVAIEAPSQTVLGQAYTFPDGVPLIEVFKITIEPGMKTAPHKHAIPLLAYVLSGELGVDYGSRGKKTFSMGQAYIEAINWCHVGYAAGDATVELLGVYLGQQDPNQIKPEPCDRLE